MKSKTWSLFFIAMVSIISFSHLDLRADSDDGKPELKMSAKDPIAQIVRQIAALEEQKKMFTFRAQMRGREADRAMTRDWMQYQFSIKEQERNQELADALGVQIKQLDAKKKQLENSLK